MKTFLIVALYASMVTATDLGGAVWNHLRSAHPVKAAAGATAVASVPVKAGSAVPAPDTIPSDT